MGKPQVVQAIPAALRAWLDVIDSDPEGLGLMDRMVEDLPTKGAVVSVTLEQLQDGENTKCAAKGGEPASCGGAADIPSSHRDLLSEKMEPIAGIEPTLVAYRATVLPLNYIGVGAPSRSRTNVSGLQNRRSAIEL